MTASRDKIHADCTRVGGEVSTVPKARRKQEIIWGRVYLRIHLWKGCYMFMCEK